MISVIKQGTNSKAISIKDIPLPTVDQVMDFQPSAKGNRTFHYKRDAFEVFVPDGMYEVVVQVTAYVKAGSAHSTKDHVVKQPIKPTTTKEAIEALVAYGFSPEDAMRLVKGK